MELDELSPDAEMPYPLPDGAMVVTIEQARQSLPEAQNVLMVLQAMSDEAHDLTDELELLLDRYSMTHPHVIEVAEHLGELVRQWQENVGRLETVGARIVSMDPGRLEWYGVVDRRMRCFHGRLERRILSGTIGWKKGFQPANPS